MFCTYYNLDLIIVCPFFDMVSLVHYVHALIIIYCICWFATKYVLKISTSFCFTSNLMRREHVAKTCEMNTQWNSCILCIKDPTVLKMLLSPQFHDHNKVPPLNPIHNETHVHILSNKQVHFSIYFMVDLVCCLCPRGIWCLGFFVMWFILFAYNLLYHISK